MNVEELPKSLPVNLLERLLTPNEYIGYLKGNALYYGMKAGKKGGSNADIDKAFEYINLLDDYL
jgi:hypothetical protein